MSDTVAKYLRLSAKNRNQKNIFAMDSAHGTEFFNVLAVQGHKGRPSKGSSNGTGCQTHTVIRNFVTGRKSTLMLSTLMERNVRKLPQKYAKHL